MGREERALRVFFALVPPPELAQSLGTLARDVARRARGRPVPAENVHLTLAFVGAWPHARLPELRDAGAQLRGAPIELRLDTLGGFRRAGVAWIGAATMSPLAVLVASLRRHSRPPASHWKTVRSPRT